MPADKNPTAPLSYDVKVLLVDDQPIVAETMKRMLAGEADMELHYCDDPANTKFVQVFQSGNGPRLVKFARGHCL